MQSVAKSFAALLNGIGCADCGGGGPPREVGGSGTWIEAAHILASAGGADIMGGSDGGKMGRCRGAVTCAPVCWSEGVVCKWWEERQGGGDSGV